MKTTRRTLGLVLAAGAVTMRAHDDEHEPSISRTALIHGNPGPFAVAGYRIGENALTRLGLKRGSMDLQVVHYAPSKVQWTCIIDGIQAATGASLGKMNLQLIESAETWSLITNRRTGQKLRFDLLPEFIQSNVDLPYEKLYQAGLKVADMKETEIFRAS